jgi:hypothetical protein
MAASAIPHEGSTAIVEIDAVDQDGAVIDLTGSTNHQIILDSPSFAAFATAAAITNSPGTDGKFRATIVGGSWVEGGEFTIQGYYEDSSGEPKYTRAVKQEVGRALLTGL